MFRAQGLDGCPSSPCVHEHHIIHHRASRFDVMELSFSPILAAVPVAKLLLPLLHIMQSGQLDLIHDVSIIMLRFSIALPDLLAWPQEEDENVLRSGDANQSSSRMAVNLLDSLEKGPKQGKQISSKVERMCLPAEAVNIKHGRKTPLSICFSCANCAIGVLLL